MPSNPTRRVLRPLRGRRQVQTVCRDAGGRGHRAPLGDGRTTRPTVRSSLATPRSTFWRLRRAYISSTSARARRRCCASSDELAIQSRSSRHCRTSMAWRCQLGHAEQLHEVSGGDLRPVPPRERGGHVTPGPGEREPDGEDLVLAQDVPARQDGEVSTHHRVERVEHRETAGQQPEHARQPDDGVRRRHRRRVVVGVDGSAGVGDLRGHHDPTLVLGERVEGACDVIGLEGVVVPDPPHMGTAGALRCADVVVEQADVRGMPLVDHTSVAGAQSAGRSPGSRRSRRCR